MASKTAKDRTTITGFNQLPPPAGDVVVDDVEFVLVEVDCGDGDGDGEFVGNTFKAII
jgi:hypothetical protein